MGLVRSPWNPCYTIDGMEHGAVGRSTCEVMSTGRGVAIGLLIGLYSLQVFITFLIPPFGIENSWYYAGHPERVPPVSDQVINFLIVVFRTYWWLVGLAYICLGTMVCKGSFDSIVGKFVPAMMEQPLQRWRTALIVSIVGLIGLLAFSEWVTYPWILRPLFSIPPNRGLVEPPLTAWILVFLGGFFGAFCWILVPFGAGVIGWTSKGKLDRIVVSVTVVLGLWLLTVFVSLLFTNTLPGWVMVTEGKVVHDQLWPWLP